MLARIDEAFPLLGTTCEGAIRIIAFVADQSFVREILAHLREPTRPATACRASRPTAFEQVQRRQCPEAAIGL